jgi:hypothetical protein
LKLAEVVSLYDKNASDIPAMLRQAADNIETGEGTDSMNALAVLHLAAVKHAQAMIDDDD